MWRKWPGCFLMIASSVCLIAQNPQPQPPPPQSARQALIEMFMGKGADDFAKHLPEDARKILLHKGDTPESSNLLKIAMIGREVVSQRGGQIETFEAGPNILVSEDPNTHEKVEVGVEHDSLMGEEDEIELSIHTYKDGEPEFLPVIPRLIFTLKQEKDVWKLTEVTVAVHAPLTDPDYLKGLRKEQDQSNQSSAQSRLMMMAQAESRYAATHKELGYTCGLANLFPTPESGEIRTQYVPTFANEESNGYRFTLSGCDGPPASKYRLTATPLEADTEMKVLCVDESGTIKSVTTEKKSACFTSGHVEMNGAAVIPAVE